MLKAFWQAGHPSLGADEGDVKLLLFMAQNMARRKSARHALTLRDGERAFPRMVRVAMPQKHVCTAGSCGSGTCQMSLAFHFAPRDEPASSYNNAGKQRFDRGEEDLSFMECRSVVTTFGKRLGVMPISQGRAPSAHGATPKSLRYSQYGVLISHVLRSM